MTNWSATLPLTMESVKQHVAKSGGVFRLNCSKRRDLNVFYVANCEDLCRSLVDLIHGVTYNHLLVHYLSQPGVGFRFYPTDNAAERSQVEEIELAKWHPSCNGPQA